MGKNKKHWPDTGQTEDPAGVNVNEEFPAAGERETENPSNQPEPLVEDEPTLREMLAREQEQLEECRGRLVRLQADFDNFRRRTRQEKEQWFRQASEDLVNALLPVLDNFERAIKAPGGDLQNFTTGVQMIRRQLDEVLAEHGLEPMVSEGADFDPECHECVERVTAPDQSDNAVVEELRRGYYYRGKVLRPAMVRVNQTN
ncbi:MAG: nucleotide exchange factor GrpE [Desulforudis sp.]|jgi:molecular chaperone GrpE|nr:nucleotide exchange factor GrpE [Clostridia bacterium]MDQ7792292.1 nucleotide exchange factor GrpE [Clostridia bacterium]RJX22467.1 MAG: nucleotide exchange factor GrpE [Desulforudis sp.]